jgi:putative tricarboxylic transport membrane protein
MSGDPQGREKAAGPARVACHRKSAETVVAALFLLAGGLVVYDSIRLGAKWAEDGPQAGYFPFFIGLILCVSALVNFVAAIRVGTNEAFVETEQFKLVMAVLVPSAVYVGLVGWLGIYAASILFIAFFMRWLG